MCLGRNGPPGEWLEHFADRLLDIMKSVSLHKPDDRCVSPREPADDASLLATATDSLTTWRTCGR